MKHTSINKQQPQPVKNRMPRLRRCVALCALLIALTLRAGDFNEEQLTFLRSVTSSYTAWQSVELNGKLHMDKLPVTASLKIYMERGRTLYISVRAPFIGEAGRIEIQGNRLTAVNKLKRKYVQEDLSNIAGPNFPVRMEDVQDFLLARAFILEYGTLSEQNQVLCNVYNEQDCWLLVPLAQPAGGSVRYGYTFDFQSRLQDLYVTTVSENYSALAQYNYNGKKTSIILNLQLRNKYYNAELELDAPKWEPSKALEPIDINKNWQRVDFRTFLRSF